MVKCEPDQILPILFTRHGPVVYQDHDRSLAVAISTVFTCPGTAPYMGSIKSMRATSLHEFPKALVGWGAPSVNMLYADVAGDICWQAAAFVARRISWRGLTRVSGMGDCEWQGYMTATELPAIENPEQSFVHSANELNLPDGWDHETNPVGFEWFEDGRADRIAEVIAAGGARNIADNQRLQTDKFSTWSLRLIAQLPEESPTHASTLLREWDGRSDRGSAAALLFEL